MSTQTDTSHLKAAGEHLGIARDHVTVGVADAVNAGVDAAREVKAEISDKLDDLLDKGKDMLDQAEELILARPWASFGVAFAAGYLIAKLARRSS